ncbi:Polysaccharide deacetylase [hydrothermal vent metagenome]|uniref:Polysaccharide deacetylase n=1 Tax=hydrothermal vent metagenome TaxID=652676 RepID=A0A3B0TWR5_9ZZZZ
MLRYRTINALTIVLLLLLSYFDRSYNIPWWYYALLILGWILITIFGSFLIRWNYHLTSLHSNKNCINNEVAISFDDGPNSEYTPKVLALLKQYEAKATFFCIGENIEPHNDLLKKIIEEGHLVGNHTYTHSKGFGFFGTKKVIDELQKTNSIVHKLTGKEMRLYRPAFGVTNPNIKKALAINGVQSIGWSVRSLDTTDLSEAAIVKRITSNISKGDIILLHDTSAKTVAVLEQLLLFLQEKKLRSVTVDRLLQIEAYA